MSLSLFLGCSPTGELIDEKKSHFERGKLCWSEKNKEALEEFLAVTRRMIESPQSHLECRRLHCQRMSIKIRCYDLSFSSILLLEPNAASVESRTADSNR